MSVIRKSKSKSKSKSMRSKSRKSQQMRKLKTKKMRNMRGGSRYDPNAIKALANSKRVEAEAQNVQAMINAKEKEKFLQARTAGFSKEKKAEIAAKIAAKKARQIKANENLARQLQGEEVQERTKSLAEMLEQVQRTQPEALGGPLKLVGNTRTPQQQMAGIAAMKRKSFVSSNPRAQKEAMRAAGTSNVPHGVKVKAFRP